MPLDYYTTMNPAAPAPQGPSYPHMILGFVAGAIGALMLVTVTTAQPQNQATNLLVTRPVITNAPMSTTALGAVRRGRGKQQPEPEPKEEGNALTRIVNALDFNAVRSKEDADLLYDAKYGKRGADGKMSREQYGALRRKVGGTASDYFKEWVDVKGEYTDKGYVTKDSDVSSTASYGGIVLALTLLGVLGTTVLVVLKTS